MMYQEEWMKLRAFKPLRDAGVSWAEIARAAGCDWRTAKEVPRGRDRRAATATGRAGRPGG